MSDLAEVVIEDIATVAVKSPDWIAYPIYYEFEIFRTDDFNKYKEEMKVHLERWKSPRDNSLEQFNVGLNTKLSCLQTPLSGCQSIHEQNLILLSKLATESNQAIIRGTQYYTNFTC